MTIGDDSGPADTIGHSDLACLRYWDKAAGQSEYSAELPIPLDRDLGIIELLGRAVRLGALEQVATLVHPDAEAQTLRVFAVRMAALAVRREDPELLRMGLLAIGIASVRSIDIRDELLVLAPLWRTAQLVTEDPTLPFEAAATELPPAAEFFRDWIARPADAQSLECMGYYESTDADGFRYVNDPYGPMRDILEQDFARRHPLIRKLLSRQRRRWLREHSQEP